MSNEDEKPRIKILIAIIGAAAIIVAANITVLPHITDHELSTIQGTVTDRNGMPVAGAVVEIDGLSVTTDASGIYVIHDVSVGMKTIVVRVPGAEITKRTLIVPKGDEIVICNVLIPLAPPIECFGDDLWAMKLVNGNYVRDYIIELNSSQCDYDPFMILREEFGKIGLGYILYNPPKEMKVGKKERIEVRISREYTQALTEGLKGTGELRIEEIKVDTYMRACLSGENFDIDDLSSEEQIIPPDGEYTEWVWNVKPLKSGIQILTLIVTIRMQIPDHGEEKWDLPALEEEVTVKVNPIYTIREFFGDNWQWVVTTVISSSIIGWFMKKRRGGKRGRELPSVKDNLI